MDAAGLAKLITLLCLVAVFIAAVLITARIWHANDGAKKGGEEAGQLLELNSARKQRRAEGLLRPHGLTDLRNSRCASRH